MAKRQVLIGVAALVATGIGIVLLVHHRCKVDEQRALDEIVRYGLETRAFAFDVNDQGYVSPAKLVQPSDDQPSVRLLPGRYLLEERGGYRFAFEGHDSEPAPNRRPRVHPAYQGFTYSAVPLPASCTRRSFLLSSETMAIHAREDGQLPTTDDPVFQKLDGTPISP